MSAGNDVEQWDNVKQLLRSLGEDVTREGLEETPRRYCQFLDEFINGEKEWTFTTFAAEGAREMIVLQDIPFYSLCEHHLVPFFGTAIVGYIPNERIAGISKLARTVDHFAKRLQNQERITTQVADFLIEQLQPKGVGVIIKARHLCMEMRGVQKRGGETITSALRGVMLDEQMARAEFMSLIK